MKNINETQLMRTPESNRLLQLTSALAEERSCLKGSFFLWNYWGRIVQEGIGKSFDETIKSLVRRASDI